MALNLNIEKEHLVDLFDKTRSELVRQHGKAIINDVLKCICLKRRKQACY